jgi:hypothetical protein
MARSNNQNALKHGAFSKVVLLPNDDPKEFEKLLASVYKEWNPEGPTEEDKVLSITLGLWRKQRFRRTLIKQLDKLVQGEKFIERHDNREFEVFVSALEDLESDSPSITEENLGDKVGSISANKIKEFRPRKNYDSDDAWRLAIKPCITAYLEYNLKNRSETTAIHDEASIEYFIDREQGVEERIDAKIDRDVKQLGQMQTMKAIGIGRGRMPAPEGPIIEIEAPSLQTAQETSTHTGSDI